MALKKFKIGFYKKNNIYKPDRLVEYTIMERNKKADAEADAQDIVNCSKGKIDYFKFL